METRSNGSSENLVIPPGGPRDSRLVHRVQPGQAVRMGTDGTFVVPAVHPSRRRITPDALPERYVVTPGGPRHSSLVHHVGGDQALRAEGGAVQLIEKGTGRRIVEVTKNAHAANAPALGSGWITYAYWNNGSGTPISSFQTTWTVPAEPSTRSGQLIYLFNGIQNYGANYGILQPVLQWGRSPAGGGNYWAVASWYVTSGGDAYHNTAVKVAAGDILLGLMKLTKTNIVPGTPTTYDYSSEFRGLTGTTLSIQNIAELLWCNETLEAYGVTQASDYPNAAETAYIGIEIVTGSVAPTVTWTPVNSVTDVGQHTTVVSNSSTDGEVDLFYGSADKWIKSLYGDLLGRAPDPSGFAYWISRRNAGATFDDIANGFLNSLEYCNNVVTSFYRLFLDRAPDASGLQAWTNALQRAEPFQSIVRGFCDSAEFKIRNPVPGPFVEALYNRLLGRGSDPDGKRAWVGALQAGRSTADVVDGFLGSEEYTTQKVTGLYQWLLGRGPDPDGLRSWVSAMMGGAPFQQIERGFLLSDEYKARSAARF
jgi:hypothetical protein